ncbi:MAG TPA: arginine--tRNA ligase, partial [Acidiferrobacteraceae bacterium]|nr:arginine--tRNA ligase [Acidiferrobacteraceae bacterium]
MKSHLASLIAQALKTLQIKPRPEESAIEASIERARQTGHGDFASTVGFLLSKSLREPPRLLAERICAALPASTEVARAEVAGPGFINFYLRAGRRQQIVRRIVDEGRQYGRSQLGAGHRILLEFVSANPNGPLHVGHGRGAAFGDSLARLLAAAGYEVAREYYVNDAGRQMDILAMSVWLRYLERLGLSLPFPANGYRGAYVRDIAAALEAQHGDTFRASPQALLADLPPDEAAGGDKERYIDALIERGRQLLGIDGYRTVHAFGLQAMLADIRADLAEFGVTYDRWFSEYSLFADGAVARALAALEQAGHTYRADGAIWFRSTHFGDEKDRVLVRENGVPTYFASDIAYHLNKLERGFQTSMDVW